MKKKAAVLIVALSLMLSSNAFAMEGRTSSNLNGIDVSHWDGTIDWRAVKTDGVKFAYIKATSGASTIDTSFSENVRNARLNGIPVGAYHYAVPSSPYNPQEAVQQATFFVSTIKNSMKDYGDIMPVLDLEEGTLSPDEFAQWTRLFVDTTKKLTNRNVMLYTGIWFIQENGNFNNKLSDLPLWVAYYERYNGGSNPPNIAGWSQWLMWQYNDQEQVKGIQVNNVDRNAGPTSLDALKGYLNYYTVQNTDTFWLVSQKLGISVSNLMAANPNVNPNNLQAGMLLKLPSSTSGTSSSSKNIKSYQVQMNDTFWTIAQKVGVSVADLIAANPNVDPANLQTGTMLYVRK